MTSVFYTVIIWLVTVSWTIQYGICFSPTSYKPSFHQNDTNVITIHGVHSPVDNTNSPLGKSSNVTSPVSVFERLSVESSEFVNASSVAPMDSETQHDPPSERILLSRTLQRLLNRTLDLGAVLGTGGDVQGDALLKSREMSASGDEEEILSTQSGTYYPSHTSSPISDELFLNTSVFRSLDCLDNHTLCSKPIGSRRRRRQCSCNSDCLLYGDCCMDTIHSEESEALALPKVKLSCETMKGWDDASGVFVVNSCAEEWEDDEIASHCEGRDFQGEDNFHRLPVTDLASNFTYRNIYCAVCNKATNLTVWKTRLTCSGNASDNYSNCTVKFEPKGGVARTCERGFVSSCPKDWVGSSSDIYSSINRKCNAHFAPVLDEDRTKYKNKFCALCNGARPDKLVCRGRWGIIRAPTRGSLPSLSIIIDIDFTKGGTIVGTTERCPPSQIYDIWKQVCRNVICGSQFEYRDGKCVLKFHRDQFSTNTMLSNCPKIKVSAEDFTIRDNGSVKLAKIGKVLEQGSFEYVSNDTIVVCAPDQDVNYIQKFGDMQAYLTLIGTSISLLSLLIKITLYLLNPEPKKLPPRIVFFLSLSLFIAQFLLLVGTYKVDNYQLCAAFGIIMHYCFLASFFWTSVLAYDIWRTFSSFHVARSVSTIRQMACYSAYGWLLPMVIVFVAAILDFTVDSGPLLPRYGRTICWISNRIALLVFFAVPLAVLVTANAAFFASTAARISRTARDTRMAHENRGSKDRVRLVLYVKLALIMGITWIFGFVAAYGSSDVLWCLFTLFNSCQGVYLLFAFTKCRLPSVLRPLRLRHRLLRISLDSRLSSTSTAVSKL